VAPARVPRGRSAALLATPVEGAVPLSDGRPGGKDHRRDCSPAQSGRQPAPRLRPDKILAQHPFCPPVKTKRSFAPRVHAFSREVRKAMVETYAWFVAAFRDAAEKVSAGDRMARFPEGSFPPGLPFV